MVLAWSGRFFRRSAYIRSIDASTPQHLGSLSVLPSSRLVWCVTHVCIGRHIDTSLTTLKDLTYRIVPFVTWHTYVTRTKIEAGQPFSGDPAKARLYRLRREGLSARKYFSGRVGLNLSMLGTYVRSFSRIIWRSRSVVASRRLEEMISPGSMASPINGLSLSTRINQNITESSFPRNSKALFIPRILLDSITQEAIIQHLNPQRLHRSLIEYIAQRLRELFAIFVAIAMPTDVIIEFIVVLQQEGATDNQIPQICELMAKFPKLNAVWKGHVNGHRYIFRAPVFTQQLRSDMIHIHHEIPLPVYFCHKTSWSGGFGTVYQVRIHRMFEERSPDEVRFS